MAKTTEIAKEQIDEGLVTAVLDWYKARKEIDKPLGNDPRSRLTEIYFTNEHFWNFANVPNRLPNEEELQAFEFLKNGTNSTDPKEMRKFNNSKKEALQKVYSYLEETLSIKIIDSTANNNDSAPTYNETKEGETTITDKDGNQIEFKPEDAIYYTDRKDDAQTKYQSVDEVLNKVYQIPEDPLKGLDSLKDASNDAADNDDGQKGEGDDVVSEKDTIDDSGNDGKGEQDGNGEKETEEKEEGKEAREHPSEGGRP